MPAFPDLTQFYMSIYGGYGLESASGYLGLATGRTQAGNPPFAVNDFLTIYPKFLGTPIVISGVLALNSPIITGIASTAGCAIGQLIVCQGVNSSTVITGVTSDSITCSSNPTIAGTASIQVYIAPLVPLAVMQLYINLATASLMSSRWREAWALAMGLYVAHFLTLYLQTDGNPQTTAGQIVSNSLQTGITISQGADGLSQGLQALTALNQWAAWTLTQYGVQLSTMARVVGAGMVVIR